MPVSPMALVALHFDLQSGDELIDRTGAVLLGDRENRVLYPVVTRTAFATFIQNVSGRRGGEPSDVHNIWFLFKGEQPLELTLSGSGETDFQVPVQFARTRQYNRYVKQWWQAFAKATAEQIEASDYPPIVETYLGLMIGRRLGLVLPDRFEGRRDPLMQTLELLFSAETIRLETIRDSMTVGVDQSAANQPIPQPIQWTPLVVTDLPDDVEIEPLAYCVPEECFYLRFGTWENQLWLQRLMEEFGGDLGRMIQLRGFKYKIQSKFLNQLAIQSNEWDKLFGGSLIDDVAVIGADTYFDDGAAVGVLLHAKDSRKLKNNLLAKRNKFVQDNLEIGARLEAIQIGDETVELLSTPDNRYRSFYVVAGDCHLMTTSRKIAERFLEASSGVRSLGRSAEYRFARYNMPLSREDTVFVYLSSRFFQELLTPQHQIELRRRNQIIADIMLLEMASMVAENEGVSAADRQRMIQEGYLPVGFGSRSDGGYVEPTGQTWIDSIRGRRGFFQPIADVPVNSVTPAEADWYRNRAAFFAQSIKSMDPMFIAIKRYQLEDKIERVVYDARIAPIGEEKYSWLLSMLGPPVTREIAPSPKDIIRLQVSMQGGINNPKVPPHQIFAAVQDELDANVDLRARSFLRMMETMREAPGYIGAWPTPGYLDWLPALGGEPNSQGYTYSRLLKLWRLQWNGFSVLSFDQQRLERLKPHLNIVESERPAQVRLVVGNLANSDLNAWANAVNYRRSWQTSIANVRFLNLLTQQFRISPQMARQTAERMLDVELVCSLGGEYELARLPSGRLLWFSDAWPSFSQPALPADHSAPLLTWFRGLELEVIKGETQYSAHGFLDIERRELESSLPSFDLFGGFGNLFGSQKPKAEDSDQDEITLTDELRQSAN